MLAPTPVVALLFELEVVPQLLEVLVGFPVLLLLLLLLLSFLPMLHHGFMVRVGLTLRLMVAPQLALLLFEPRRTA